MCTLQKQGSLFILTLTGDAENRLNPTVIAAILSALSEVRSQATAGAALITTATGKFFSNGYDLRWAAAGAPAAAVDRLRHMVDSFKPVISALMSLPMPTIAAVSGHAAGAGVMLAVAHDHVIMRGDKGFLYMPEVDLGMTLPDYFAVGLRAKIRSPAALREVLLGGRKVTAAEAVEMGIVDSAHDSVEGVVEASVRLGERLVKRKWNGEVYAEIRKSLYPEMCAVLGLTQKSIVAKI